MDSNSLPSDIEGLLENEEAPPEYERLWSLLRRVDAARGAAYDVDREWEQLADRLDLEADAPPVDAEAPAAERRAPDRAARPAEDAPPSRRWIQAVAAAVLVAVLVGGGWWWAQPVQVRTAAGEQAVVTLPDGSTAELNGATTLSYPRGVAALPWTPPARRVRLDGEAYFSVDSRERPFHVSTANARVTVLGTAFNVRARRAEGTPDTEVVLASGRVAVRGEGTPVSERAVRLTQGGQASRVRGTADPTPPTAVDLKYVAAWRQGGFALAGAALPVVLRELERRFGTSLQLRVPVAQTDTMTLHYARDAQLTNVLRDICLIQDLSYRETSQGYELVRAEAAPRPGR